MPFDCRQKPTKAAACGWKIPATQAHERLWLPEHRRLWLWPQERLWLQESQAQKRRRLWLQQHSRLWLD